MYPSCPTTVSAYPPTHQSPADHIIGYLNMSTVLAAAGRTRNIAKDWQGGGTNGRTTTKQRRNTLVLFYRGKRTDRSRRE